MLKPTPNGLTFVIENWMPFLQLLVLLLLLPPPPPPPFLIQTRTIFLQFYKINIRIFILKNMTNFHVFLWIYYCVGIMFFLHVKGDDLLVGGDEREHQQSSRCKYVGRVGFGVILLQQSCFSSLKRKKQHKKTQEVTIKLDLSLSCSQNVNCLYVNI